MQDSYPNLVNSATTKSVSTCRRCGGGEFFSEEAKPPHHLVERCKACGLFSRFIPKPKPYPETAEVIVAAFAKPLHHSTKPSVSDSPVSRHEFEDLKKLVEKMDCELRFYARIFGASNRLPKEPEITREIGDDEIMRFNQSIGG